MDACHHRGVGRVITAAARPPNTACHIHHQTWCRCVHCGQLYISIQYAESREVHLDVGKGHKRAETGNNGGCIDGNLRKSPKVLHCSG